MCKRRFLGVLLAAWMVVVAAGAARAAEDVTRAVPDGALAFATFSKLAATDAKIQKLAGEMKLPAVGLLEALKTAAGVKDGLDEHGTAAVVLLAPEEDGDEPVAMLFVPVTDYPAVLKQLKAEDAAAKVAKVTVFDSPMLMGLRGGFAVLAERDKAGLLEKALDAPKSVAEEVAVLGVWPGEHEVAGVLTRKGIEFFADKALEGIREMKKMFAEFGADGDAKDAMAGVVATFEFYEKVLVALRQETALLAGGLRLDAQGNLLAEGRVRWVAEGKAVKALAGLKPLGRDLLAGLPDGPYVFAAAGAVPSELTEAMLELSMNLVRNNPMMSGMFGSQPADVDKYMEVSRGMMRHLKGMSMVMGVGRKRDPLYANTVGLLAVDDAPAYLDGYVKALREATRGTKDDKSILAGMKVEKEKIGDADGVKLSMKVPLPAMPGADDMPEVKKMMEDMMEKFYGPGGVVTTYFAPADKQTVVMGYTSAGPAEKTLRAVRQGEKGLAGNAQLRATAALLPADAAWTMYWCPNGTIELFKRLMQLMAAEAPVPMNVPDFPAGPPVGATLSAAPGELRLHAAVPKDTLKAGAAWVRKIMQASEAGEVQF